MAPEGCGPVCGPQVATLQHLAFPITLSEISSLPRGFPTSVDSALAWDGACFKSESEYVLFLTQDHVREIENALLNFKKLGLDGDLVCRQNFLLPTLENDLNQLRCEIHSGKGFGLIRGLEPRRYSVEDLTTIYLGLQSYIANLQGRQDKKGNMLVHIIADNSTKMRASHHRHSTSPITFHNEEGGDVVSWLTRSTSIAGGRCILASAHTIYNALAASRPDLVRALARSDWPFALAALLGSASHPRPDTLPKLTNIQLEALDAVEAIAKATQLEIKTQAGDIHFINNLAVLHRREGFVDGTLSTEKRHLVRMRLRDEAMGWSIPQELQHEWTQAFSNAALARVWHVEPMPDGYFPLRSQSN
ncbi:hypothetical protein E4U53_005780 [Claviceps sorghi]|nr:hypothetical protein E4U53_005780 [Claviceps sorghi]